MRNQNIYSGRQVYVAIKYLKGIKHYDDEDGWNYPDRKELGKYTYKWVLAYMRENCQTCDDIWTKIFMSEEPLKKLCEIHKISLVDQLFFESSEWQNKVTKVRKYRR